MDRRLVAPLFAVILFAFTAAAQVPEYTVVLDAVDENLLATSIVPIKEHFLLFDCSLYSLLQEIVV